MYRLLKELQDFESGLSVYPFGQYVHFTPVTDSITPENIMDYLNKKNITATEIKEINANIEDVFMELMSKGQSK